MIAVMSVYGATSHISHFYVRIFKVTVVARLKQITHATLEPRKGITHREVTTHALAQTVVSFQKHLTGAGGV
jgi:hypothetical protein